MGRRRMKNYNPMAIAESPMTAPDSVERVVAEMRIPHEGGWDNDDVAALADRLQALARGPQQAGGEDAVQAAARIASEAACLRIDNERLQAEVARLREILWGYGDARGTVWYEKYRQLGVDAGKLLDRAIRTEAALRLAHSHLDMPALRVSHCKDAAAIDAALNGGQDDA